MKNNHEKETSITAAKNALEEIKLNSRLRSVDDKLSQLKSLAATIVQKIDEENLQVPELKKAFESLQEIDITGLPDAIKVIATAYQEGKPDETFSSFIDHINAFNQSAIELEADIIKLSHKITGITDFAQRLAASVVALCAAALSFVALIITAAVFLYVSVPMLLGEQLAEKLGASPPSIWVRPFEAVLAISDSCFNCATTLYNFAMTGKWREPEKGTDLKWAWEEGIEKWAWEEGIEQSLNVYPDKTLTTQRVDSLKNNDDTHSSQDGYIDTSGKSGAIKNSLFSQPTDSNNKLTHNSSDEDDEASHRVGPKR